MWVVALFFMVCSTGFIIIFRRCTQGEYAVTNDLSVRQRAIAAFEQLEVGYPRPRRLLGDR
jgi:hypothetical protein